jgi:hypothetical protein
MPTLAVTHTDITDTPATDDPIRPDDTTPGPPGDPVGWMLTPAELDATEAKIATINERARRRGFTGRITVESHQVQRTSINQVGLEVTEIRYATTLTGEAPCYNGWTLLATLDWDSAEDLIVRTAPGVTSVNREGLEPGYCAHCKTTRRRYNTYLVGNTTTGEQVQVGSTCIRDFLGWPGGVVFYDTRSVSEEVDGALGGCAYEPTFTTLTVLAAAWAATTTFGYVRADDWGRAPTKSVVSYLINPRTPTDRQAARECAPAIAEAAGMAAKLRAWLLSEEFDGDSEYVRNLKIIAGSEMVTPRNFGLLVSAPQAWARAQDRSLIRERERAEIVDEYLGEVKKRLVLTVRVRAVDFLPGTYGVTTLYTMTDKDGHLLKWFASRQVLGEEPSDEWITIKATVKAHEEFRGRKETVLSRCAVQ